MTGGLITAAIGVADDAVEALRGRVGLHLHVADRLFEPDGGDRRNPHRRLLGHQKEASCRSRICSSWTGSTATRRRQPPGDCWFWLVSILPVVPGFFRAAMTPGGQVADPTIWDSLYTYAWFVTFALSFALYIATFRTGLARLIMRREMTKSRKASCLRRGGGPRPRRCRVGSVGLSSARRRAFPTRGWRQSSGARIARSVVATGKIEPITKVEIKSKANGIIKLLPSKSISRSRRAPCWSSSTART